MAKQVFQLHGATADGEIVFRNKLSRKQFLAFMLMHPGCIVAVHGPSLAAIGHEVCLIAPKFVKPYLKNRERHELVVVGHA
ncbi:MULTISPECIES: hypothetical protein [Rhodobacterales]|uniref:Uncharacterized protein n=1 Tax=Pseudodonghicola flavimaris TaxID=3050036 RepID=A0ABT7F748_9RHOB|nr:MULTISPECIES: hypothetical protein [Rhodobacterales]MDK3020424.1 hypothetical protein [Pseudodonghicola flavimaris]